MRRKGEGAVRIDRTRSLAARCRCPRRWSTLLPTPDSLPPRKPRAPNPRDARRPTPDTGVVQQRFPTLICAVTRGRPTLGVDTERRDAPPALPPFHPARLLQNFP